MKKLLTILFMGTLMLSSCNSGPKYTIAADLGVEDYDGKKVYLKSLMGDKLDSTTVKAGVINFSNAFKAPELVIASIDQGYQVIFVLEEGNNLLNFQIGSVKAGPLNEKRNAQLAKNQELADKVAIRYNDIETKLQNEELTEEQKNNLTQDFIAYYNTEIIPQTVVLQKEYLRENADNILAVDALIGLSTSIESDEEMQGILAHLDPQIGEHPFVKKIQSGIDVRKNVVEGKPFVDFSGIDADGKKQSLSNYAGKGKYLLIDFWASWCGPCRESMPLLKELYKKYQDKNFEILGVAVWDELSNTKQAIEMMELPWPQILNTQEAATELYGIKGIPHIMLIDPTGVIIERNLFGKDIEAVLSDLLH